MKMSKKMQQLILLVSIASFAGTTIVSVVNLFTTEVSSQPQVAAPPEAEILKSQLQGYQAVLQREPNNQTALEGLVTVQMQLGDEKGAIEALEKLVKLYPERSDYRDWLVVAQRNSSDTKQ